MLVDGKEAPPVQLANDQGDWAPASVQLEYAEYM